MTLKTTARSVWDEYSVDSFRSIFPRRLALCPKSLKSVCSFFFIYPFSSYLLNIPKMPVTVVGPRNAGRRHISCPWGAYGPAGLWGSWTERLRNTKFHKVLAFTLWWTPSLPAPQLSNLLFSYSWNFQYFMLQEILSVISEKPNYWDIHSFIHSFICSANICWAHTMCLSFCWVLRLQR